MAAASSSFTGYYHLSPLNRPRIQVNSPNPCRTNFPVRSQGRAESHNAGGSGRRIWRRKKLTKKDGMSQHLLQRVPFLEEQVRKIRDSGKLLQMDIERLMLSEENRYDFVNEVAAEAKEYVERDREAYGGAKKAIFHVLSNRMNEAGFDRSEAYVVEDPFKPGPGYTKKELYDV